MPTKSGLCTAQRKPFNPLHHGLNDNLSVRGLSYVMG